jgi:hypothetical protein
MATTNSKISKFCVIGPRVGRVNGEHYRKWFDKETGPGSAEEHAQELLKGRQPGSAPAFVVEVKRVIEVEPHPIVTRAPHKSDFPYED